MYHTCACGGYNAVYKPTNLIMTESIAPLQIVPTNS